MLDRYLEEFKDLRSINRDKKCCEVRLAAFLRVFQLAVKKLVNLFAYVYLHRILSGEILTSLTSHFVPEYVTDPSIGQCRAGSQK